MFVVRMSYQLKVLSGDVLHILAWKNYIIIIVWGCKKYSMRVCKGKLFTILLDITNY